MLKKEDGRLDFRLPARVLEARLRGFTPWPGAFTTIAGRLLKVLKVRVGDGRGEPGVVLVASGDCLEVACGEGSLRLDESCPKASGR